MYSIIFKNSPVGIVIIDAATKIVVDINTAACFMFGSRDNEIIGTTYCKWSCSKKLGCPIVNGQCEQSMENEEIIITRKDNSDVHLLCTSTNILVENKLYVVETIIDRTEKRKLEQKYDELMTYAPAGIYELDLKTFSFLSVNELMIKFTGYTEGEFKLMSAFDLLTESSKNVFIDRMHCIMNGEAVPTTVELEIMTKTGTPIWVLLNVRWIYGDDKVPIKAFCIATDITARKKAMLDLIESKNKAQMYLDLAYGMFIALDTKGKITLINKAGCDVLGIDECFLVGQDWFDNYIPIEEREIVRNYFNLAVKTNDFSGVYDFENHIITSGGKKRLIRFKNKLIANADGICIGSFSSGDDVTEERRLEEITKILWNKVGNKMDDMLSDLKKSIDISSITTDILQRENGLSETLNNIIKIK